MMASTAKNRFGNVGSGSNLPNGEQSRPLPGSNFVSGFGNGSTGWIWGGTAAVGSGRRTNCSVESGRNQDDIPGFTGNIETIAGGGSFLGSENWGSHHANQWKTVDNTSPTLSSSHQSSSSMRRQSSTQLLPHTYGESNSSNSPYFPSNQGGTLTQGMVSKPSRKVFQDSTTANFVSNPFDKAQITRSSRHGSEDDNPYSSVFHSDNTSTRIQLERQSIHQNFSGYNSSAASQIGSLPPSRNGVDPSRGDDAFNTQNSQLGPSTSNASQRQNLLTHTTSHTPRTGSYGPKSGGQPSPPQLSGLSGDFSKMNFVSRDGQSTYFSLQKKTTQSGNTPFPQDFSHQAASNGTSNTWEDNGYPAGLNGFNQDAVFPGGLPPHQNIYHSPPFATPYSHSPSNGDPRRSQQSSFYPSAGTTPSGIPHRISKSSLLNGSSSGSTVLVERSLHGLQQEQQDYPSQPNQIQFRPPPFHQSYDLHPQSPIRMNPLAYYPAVSNLLATPAIPRGPARENDIGQPVRSTLLEDFRASSKTNKRYELKDIYDHVVEFSGDQHGSRFIQQKLETANSDEKEQVFREIHPNSLQLMTDVFGNYVIQKFFEHGNQGQKKILAGQMKNHILTLSMQMYGCRVVQKALEHILTDQQALLVKELENHVLKCVKDQNGNHVIQKAIERVPAEHIQFIISAFTGQVLILASHPYGCRVIQRMLEHCEEPTRSALLKELHACAVALITDQYGNYVTQHVIEHGREEDRAKIILLITGNLVFFSKHKFASNVVEKSIQFGTPGQRAKIISTLTVLNQHGDSPLQSVIRDQYGNYVIQKLLTQLRGSESENFIELIKPQLALLKRFSYGKQIAAIEKMVYNNATLPPQAQKTPGLPQPIDTSATTSSRLIAGDTHSPHSVSIPSTDASTCSRKSSASHTQELDIPNSTR